MTLKNAREAAGLSQNDLAIQSGINLAVIRKIEQGLTDPKKASSETVAKLAQALEVPEFIIRQHDDDPQFETIDGRIVVDALTYMRNSWDIAFIQVGDNWYTFNVNAPINPQPYEGPISQQMLDDAEHMWGNHNSSYITLKLVPRGGFKLNIGRAATPDEITALQEAYPEWGEPIEVTRGAAYGKSAMRTITVRQFKVSPEVSNPITVESQLQDKGIEANATSYNIVQIRVA